MLLQHLLYVKGLTSRIQVTGRRMSSIYSKITFALYGFGRVVDLTDHIQVLNVSPFSTEKYKREFTNTDQACEVDENYKTRNRLVFDL